MKMSKRKPNVGDVVYIAPFRCRRNESCAGYFYEVVKVGRVYFYTDNNVAFEIDSFRNGVWVNQRSQHGVHSNAAYLSKEVFDKIMLKQKRIEAIRSYPDMDDFSYAKIEAVWTILFTAPNMYSREDWEDCGHAR